MSCKHHGVWIKYVYMTYIYNVADKNIFSLLKSNFDLDIYDVGSMDDSMYKQHKANLNLTLEYNDA